MDFISLDIDREWGRDPGWFWTQDQETQARLYAHWKLRNCPQDMP